VTPDDQIHSQVELATRLRHDYASGVYGKVSNNRHTEEAYEKILELLETSRGRKLTDDEKRNARTILFGHSWGGSAAIKLARRLDAAGIPVLLAVQVGSVAKFHEDDSIIPENVAQAVNLFQADGRLHGCPKIVAANPSRMRILVNFRFD
jgi:surfactin synthase thioesterase subunit